MKFTITGKIKPYTRMTRRGKWVNEQAREYMASQTAIGLQIRSQMNGDMLPQRTPLKAIVEIEQPGALHISDLDNLAKALIDAAQGVAFLNDCWIDELQASRQIGGDYKAVLILEAIQ